MNPQQKELVKAIKAYYKKHNYPCQQTYLARLFNVSRSTMADRVNTLVNKGILRKTEGGQVFPTS